MIAPVAIELPFGLHVTHDLTTYRYELRRGPRVVAWIAEEAIARDEGVIWSWLNLELDRMGMAPVELKPTHRTPEPDYSRGEPDPAYLWHLFMGRDPATFRR